MKLAPRPEGRVPRGPAPAAGSRRHRALHPLAAAHAPGRRSRRGRVRGRWPPAGRTPAHPVDRSRPSSRQHSLRELAPAPASVGESRCRRDSRAQPRGAARAGCHARRHRARHRVSTSPRRHDPSWRQLSPARPGDGTPSRRSRDRAVVVHPHGADPRGLHAGRRVHRAARDRPAIASRRIRDRRGGHRGRRRHAVCAHARHRRASQGSADDRRRDRAYSFATAIRHTTRRRRAERLGPGARPRPTVRARARRATVVGRRRAPAPRRRVLHRVALRGIRIAGAGSAGARRAARSCRRVGARGGRRECGAAVRGRRRRGLHRRAPTPARRRRTAGRARPARPGARDRAHVGALGRGSRRRRIRSRSGPVAHTRDEHRRER